VAGDAEVRRCVQEACAICEIPAPTGSEGRRAGWVADRLREAGLDVHVDPEGSVVARPAGGDARLVVAAHLDTVFAGVDAIAVRRDGDVLHAPGIGDNSLGVAALVHLARAGLGDGLVLAATVGEEGFGNLRGARRVVADLRPRELVALEGGGAGRLVTAGIGSARFALRATAPGGHSWSDRGRPSALHTLIEVLHRHVSDPGTASVNVGSVTGGAGINVLAPEAEATLEFRDLDEGRLTRAVERLAAEASVEVTELGRRPAGRTPDDHPLVRAAVEAAVAAGLPAPVLDASSTDANAALGAGLPAVTVGLGESRDAHTLQESVDVSGLAPALSALADLVSRRLGAP
jgi:tripeptide aminopeptidase